MSIYNEYVAKNIIHHRNNAALNYIFLVEFHEFLPIDSCITNLTSSHYFYILRGDESVRTLPFYIYIDYSLIGNKNNKMIHYNEQYFNYECIKIKLYRVRFDDIAETDITSTL